jgi:hypothetical protein
MGGETQERKLTADQQVARIVQNGLSTWWNSLTDSQRHGLKDGRLSMMEWAFEAGVRAAAHADWGRDNG